MGHPYCRKKEKALTLVDEFKFSTIIVGDLLEREVTKKSEFGKKIAEAKASNSFSNSLIAYFNSC